MNTQEFINFIPQFLNKLEFDEMSQSVIINSKRIIDYFKEYCLNNNINYINEEVINEFYLSKYNFSIYNTKEKYHFMLRRPLIVFMDYYKNNTYKKQYFKKHEIIVQDVYKPIFEMIKIEYIENLNIVAKSKRRVTWIIADLLNYLFSKDITKIEDITITTISNYVTEKAQNYSMHTTKTLKTILRLFLDWLYQKNLISFTGKQMFPCIRKVDKTKLPSTYTSDEIKSILNSIDNSTKNGKCELLILSLLIYYGIRIKDVMNLKFSNIDFNKNCISIIQTKTNQSLILPLIDEVKFPLIDYIKNGRPNSKDTEYILSTLNAPYTKFHSDASIHQIITKNMNKANIDYSNRHHGSHSMRHSLATTMLKLNIPLEVVSDILGHESTKTTNIYIAKDTTHLRELTLEVPYEL